MMQTVEIVTDSDDANCPIHSPSTFQYPRPDMDEMMEFCAVIYTEGGQRYPNCPRSGRYQRSTLINPG